MKFVTFDGKLDGDDGSQNKAVYVPFDGELDEVSGPTNAGGFKQKSAMSRIAKGLGLSGGDYDESSMGGQMITPAEAAQNSKEYAKQEQAEFDKKYARLVREQALKDRNLSPEDIAAIGDSVSLSEDELKAASKRLGYEGMNRNVQQIAGDIALSGVAGVKQIAKSLVDSVSPEGKTAQYLNESIAETNSRMSPEMRKQLEWYRQQIKDAESQGRGAEFVEAFGNISPQLAAHYMVNTLPSMAPVFAAGKVAQGLATARGATAAGAALAGARGAGVANAALNAGGARGDAFEELKQTYIEKVASEDQAIELALSDSWLPAGVGAVMGYIGGRFGAESDIIRGSVITAAKFGVLPALKAVLNSFGREITTEELEELLPKITTNLLAEKDPLDGIAEVAAQTFAGSVGMGSVGAASAGREAYRSPLERELQGFADAVDGTKFNPAGNAEEARRAAAGMQPLSVSGMAELQAMRQQQQAQPPAPNADEQEETPVAELPQAVENQTGEIPQQADIDQAELLNQIEALTQPPEIEQQPNSPLTNAANQAQGVQQAAELAQIRQELVNAVTSTGEQNASEPEQVAQEAAQANDAQAEAEQSAAPAGEVSLIDKIRLKTDEQLVEIAERLSKSDDLSSSQSTNDVLNAVADEQNARLGKPTQTIHFIERVDEETTREIDEIAKQLNVGDTITDEDGDVRTITKRMVDRKGRVFYEYRLNDEIETRVAHPTKGSDDGNMISIASLLRPGSAILATTGERINTPGAKLVMNKRKPTAEQAQQPAEEAAQPALSTQPPTPVSKPIRERETQQLIQLAKHGLPGKKEEAIAELARRGVTFEPPEEQGEAKPEAARPVQGSSTVSSNLSPIQRRDDLVGAIMRVTGGSGISAGMAQTIVGDTANNATKVRGLFTNAGVMDLDDTADLLRNEEGYDVRDGNHLAELIREQAAGNPVYSSARIEREAAKDAEKKHREEVLRRAKKYGVRHVARPFSETEDEVFRIMEERHIKAVQLLDDRSFTRFSAMLDAAQRIVSYEDLDAIVTDAHNRFEGRKVWDEARKQIRAHISDLVQAEKLKRQESQNAIEIEGQPDGEPDWISDGQPTEGSGGGSAVDRINEAGEGEATPEGSGGSQEEFSLVAQSEDDVRAQERQREDADSDRLTKEQIDRERDAVPFSLAGQSQPRPQGVQVDMIAADGRISADAAQPADQPRAETVTAPGQPEASQSPKDQGAAAFKSGAERKAPEGLSIADKARWLGGYDDAKAEADQNPIKNEAAASVQSTTIESRGATWRIDVHPSAWVPGEMAWSGYKRNAGGEFVKVESDDIPAGVAKKAAEFFDSVVNPASDLLDQVGDAAVYAENAQESKRDELQARIEDAAQKTNHDATPAQKEAGNYAKGKFAWNGLTISVETAKGEDRTDKETNGDKWRVTMPATYGYILGTKGADKDHVDLFMGDNPESESVFVVNQNQVDSQKFDEHKVMAGFASAKDAQAAYMASFEDGFGDRVFGSITGPYSIKEFREMLDAGKFEKPQSIGSPISPLSMIDVQLDGETMSAEQAIQDIDDQLSLADKLLNCVTK